MTIQDKIAALGPEPLFLVFKCESCGAEDTKQLRDGVNNHWRKGYVMGKHPRSQDAICYGSMHEQCPICFGPATGCAHVQHRREP
jgi:hypothetical protein